MLLRSVVAKGRYVVEKLKSVIRRALLRFRIISGRPGVLLADSKAKWRKVLLRPLVAKGRYVVEKLKSVIRSSDGGQM